MTPTYRLTLEPVTIVARREPKSSELKVASTGDPIPTYKLTYSEGTGPSFWEYGVYGANYVFRPAGTHCDRAADRTDDV